MRSFQFSMDNEDKAGQPAMMEEALYWQIVDDCFSGEGSDDHHLELLKAQMASMALSEIKGFYLRTMRLEDDIKTAKMWCAGFIMNGWCSDDQFIDFRRWVITTGRQSFYAAKDNPDNLIYQITDTREDYLMEDLAYVPADVFNERTGDMPFDFLSFEPFELAGISFGRCLLLNWDGREEASMRAICPLLCAHFFPPGRDSFSVE